MTGEGHLRGRMTAAARCALALVSGLLLAAGLAACGGATNPPAGSPATLTSAPGTGGAAPAALVPRGGHGSSTSPAGHTVMKQFAPLDPTGRLTASAQPGGSGSCFATSIAVPLSGVYRCLSGNTILDPCFAPAHESAPATVVCFGDPWTDGKVITLGRALPAYAPALTDGNPWAIELGNGARCVAVTGAVPVLGDVDLTYRCDDGSVAGLSTADDGTMSAQYGPSSGPLQDVDVTTAWRGRSYRF